MTLMINEILEVVKIHVRTKFHWAKCSSSRVIVVTERKCWQFRKQYCHRYRGQQRYRQTINLSHEKHSMNNENQCITLTRTFYWYMDSNKYKL